MIYDDLRLFEIYVIALRQKTRTGDPPETSLSLIREDVLSRDIVRPITSPTHFPAKNGEYFRPRGSYNRVIARAA